MSYAVWAPLLVGLAVRLHGLTRRSLWFDEARTLAAALEPLASVPAAVAAVDQNPPLYHLLCWLPLRLGADPVWALRGLSVLFGVLSLAALVPLARRLDARLGVPLLWFAALSPAAVQASQNGRPYALLLLLTALSYERFLAWRQGGGRRALAHLAAVNAALLLTHYYAVFVLATEALLAAAWAGRRWRDAAPAWASLALACLPFAAWLPVLVGHAARPVPLIPFDAKLLFFCLGSCVADFSFLTMFWDRWVAGFGVLLAAAAALGWRRARAEGGDLAAWGAAGVLGPFAAAWAAEKVLQRPMTEARYFAVCYAPFYALLAAAAAAAPRAVRAGAAAVLALGLVAKSAAELALDPRFDRLAQAARDSAGPEVPVVHLGSFDYLPLRYYYLPDRRHFLAPPAPEDLDWARLPGGGAALPEGWRGLSERFLVVDPEKRAGQGRLFLADRPRLEALLHAP